MVLSHRSRHYRMLLTQLLVLLLLTLAAIPPQLAAQTNEPELAPPDAPIEPPPDEATVTSRPTYPALSSPLNKLFDDYQKGEIKITEAEQEELFQINQDKVLVTLTFRDDTSATSAAQEIVNIGGEVVATYKRWIDAWVPIDSLDRIAQLRNVQYVIAPVLELPPEPAKTTEDQARIQSGSFVSEGVAASGADAWHAFEHTGSGVRVAVLDGGFKDYLDARNENEIPQDIEFFPNINTVNNKNQSPHGTAIAEIIHDMVPDAEITLAAVAGSPTAVAEDLIELAAERDIDVISSAITFNRGAYGPGDGTGPIAEAVTEIRNDYSTLYVQSAGNHGQKHWSGTFKDEDNNRWHEFSGNFEINSLGVMESGKQVYMVMRWNDWPLSDQDFSIYLYRYNTSTNQWDYVTNTTFAQDGTTSPVETLVTDTDIEAEYGVAIRNVNIDTNRTHVLDISGYGQTPDFQLAIPQRGLNEEAAARDAIAVVAADATTGTYENYSTQGPTYGPGGSLTGGHDQPRLTGFANVSTWSYRDRDEPFSGTSAATPHVAGAAALVSGRFPNYDADEVQSYLEEQTAAHNSSTYNHRLGYGKVHLGTPCDDTDEPNDAIFQATTFYIGRTEQHIRCPSNDEDWFSFQAPPGTTTTVEVVSQGESPAIAIYRDIITLIAEDDDALDDTPDGIARIDHPFFEGGEYFVRVTDSSNASAVDYDIRITNEAVPAPLNLNERFEGINFLIRAFEPHSTGSGRVFASTEHGPAEGGRHVILDSKIRQGSGLNELILHVDTTGFSNIQLTFDQREYGDEDHPMPAQFTNSTNADGVAFSVDGTSWYRLVSLTGNNSGNNYRSFAFNLSTLATEKGLTLGDDVQIKFQQYESGAYPVPTDGIAFDNVRVFGDN